jgi:hypothetical protein
MSGSGAPRWSGAVEFGHWENAVRGLPSGGGRATSVDQHEEVAATMFSIYQSCRLIGIDPIRYMLDNFAELHKSRTDRKALLSKAWVARIATKLA